MRDEGELAGHLRERLGVFAAAGVDAAFARTFVRHGLCHRDGPRLPLDLGSRGGASVPEAGSGATHPGLPGAPREAVFARAGRHLGLATACEKRDRRAPPRTCGRATMSAAMDLATGLAEVPLGVLVVLGVLAVLEVGLDVVALVHLYRTPRAQVLGGNKWLWVLVIVLVNLIGAILYLAIGHRPAPAADTAAAAQPPERIADVVESLYGKADEPPRA